MLLYFLFKPLQNINVNLERKCATPVNYRDRFTWRKLFSPCILAEHWLGLSNQGNYANFLYRNHISLLCILTLCVMPISRYSCYIPSIFYFAPQNWNPIGPDNVTYQLSVCIAFYFGLIVDDRVGK